MADTKDPSIRRKLSLEEFEGFRSEGARRGTDGKPYPYKIGLSRGRFEGVRYFLARGLDDETSRWLDASEIYGEDLTYEKMCLFARVMRQFAERVDGTRPDFIHAHDWNVIPAAVSMRQAFSERGAQVPLVYTIHLLGHKTFDWHYISEEWCGVRDEEQTLHLDDGPRAVTVRQAWEDLSTGKIERFGALESDFLTTVSESYLNSDVLPFVGEGAREKSGFIYNCCEWDERQLTLDILREKPIPPTLKGRSDLRRYLLTVGLGQVKLPEPKSNGPAPNSSRGRKLEPFREDGQLVIATGRLDKQKGVDVLMKAIPKVLEALPTAKFVLMMIPQPHGELIESTNELAAGFPDNVRVILWHAPASIYRLAHVAADAYAMPSRWEPFGIAALEAMATGNPVVGSRVGGITETVLDLASYGERGTGLLVEKENPLALARGLTTVLAMMRLAEPKTMSTGERESLLDAIDDEGIRELVANNPSFGSIIRENCRRRVREQFGAPRAAEMAVRAYERALEVSKGVMRSTT